MRPVVIFLHRHKNNRRVQIEKHLPALQQLIQANIFYAVILSGDLGVHIGVYQPCPDLKRTLVAMSERTGMSVSQVTDEVLYTGLIQMQELWGEGEHSEASHHT